MNIDSRIARRIILSALLGVVSAAAIAEPTPLPDGPQLAANPAPVSNDLRFSVLAAQSTWRKLLHYDPDGAAQDDVTSVVHSPEFFLAESGKSDPESELRATVSAMSAPVGDDPNDHAQCRFPARYLWLKKQSMLADVADLECPLFEEWIFGDATESISIVFATGYLGNPASYYGHTLLKFNSSEARQKSDLLDVTVNYGAIIPEGVGPISYMYNGATGGYSAGFSHIEYYFHDHNYGELELRDLWEYELSLNPAEVRFIVAHSWELLGKEYTYYFFRKNCVYRMAEVVEIVEGVEIIPPNRPWTIPQTVIRRTAESEHDGAPLVADVIYHPSRQSQFYEKYLLLDDDGRKAVRDIARKPGPARTNDILSGLRTASQQEVVEALLDYYRYLIGRDEPEDSANNVEYRNLLAIRFRLPPVVAVTRSDNSDRAGPGAGRAPGYMSLGAINNDALGSALSIRLRGAYYDVLDSSVGHVPNSVLSMVDVNLRVDDNGVSIRKFDLFYVEAVNGAVTGLPADDGRAWILAMGLVQQNLACDDCLVLRFRGDIGRTLALGESSVAGIYAGGALQDNRHQQGLAFLRLTAFVNMTGSDRFRLRAQYESRYHVDSILDFEDVFSVEGRLALSKNSDMRLRLEKNVASEAMLSIGYYW